MNKQFISPQGYQKQQGVEPPRLDLDSSAKKPRRKRTYSANLSQELEMAGKNVHYNKPVTKICFTGGPSAGKTTAISTLTGYLKDLGHVVNCVPNAEKLIVQSIGTHGLPKSAKNIKGSKKIEIHSN